MTSTLTTDKTTKATEFTLDVWKRLDSFDAQSFSELFAPDGWIAFGNGDAFVGPEAVKAGSEYFFGSIKGIGHTVINEWTQGRTTIVQLETRYDRHDGASVTIPVVSIWERNAGGLFTSYRVYFDLTPVYA